MPGGGRPHVSHPEISAEGLSHIQNRSVTYSGLLVGGFVNFTINLILDILDLYSLIVIYCDYGKE
jgi:hypothetical protein